MRELEVRQQEKVREVAEPESSCKNLFSALLSFLTTHSRNLAWKIPRTEDPGGLESMGSPKNQT